jgi:hypothetical protein
MRSLYGNVFRGIARLSTPSDDPPFFNGSPLLYEVIPFSFRRFQATTAVCLWWLGGAPKARSCASTASCWPHIGVPQITHRHFRLLPSGRIHQGPERDPR